MLPRTVLLERGAHADRWHHRHAVPLLRILPNVDRFGGEALRLAEEAIAAALEIGKKANENDFINFKLSGPGIYHEPILVLELIPNPYRNWN